MSGRHREHTTGKEKQKSQAGKKGVPLGEPIGKGGLPIFLFLCRFCSRQEAAGTNSLWSSGRLTPEAVLGMVKNIMFHM